jgi:hypothetical protein
VTSYLASGETQIRKLTVTVPQNTRPQRACEQVVFEKIKERFKNGGFSRRFTYGGFSARVGEFFFDGQLAIEFELRLGGTLNFARK